MDLAVGLGDEDVRQHVAQYSRPASNAAAVEFVNNRVDYAGIYTDQQLQNKRVYLVARILPTRTPLPRECLTKDGKLDLRSIASQMAWNTYLSRDRNQVVGYFTDVIMPSRLLPSGTTLLQHPDAQTFTPSHTASIEVSGPYKDCFVSLHNISRFTPGALSVVADISGQSIVLGRANEDMAEVTYHEIGPSDLAAADLDFQELDGNVNGYFGAKGDASASRVRADTRAMPDGDLHVAPYNDIVVERVLRATSVLWNNSRASGGAQADLGKIQQTAYEFLRRSLKA
jgi:hypothetical protein